jgi:integrase/recombinase XerD
MIATPRFTSRFGSLLASYLALKKALGRRFAAEADVFTHLDRFIATQWRGARALTAESFSAWALTLRHLTPTVRRNRMRVVRNFCLYLRRTQPSCFVPDTRGFPAPHPPARPHIFSEDQIARVLRAARELPRRHHSPLRPEVFRISIVLLYTAGLRRGELVRLLVSDYDPIEHTLLVRASKFHKSRLVALSKDATREMHLYLKARARQPHGEQGYLLINRHGGVRGYSGASLGHSLRQLFCRADVRTAHGRPPRVHDLRHTYAVHALLRWYRAGVDVQAKLPALAASMGHVSVASTAYYLAFVEQIAEAASSRFERHCIAVMPDLAGLGGRQ